MNTDERRLPEWKVLKRKLAVDYGIELNRDDFKNYLFDYNKRRLHLENADLVVETLSYDGSELKKFVRFIISNEE